LIHAGEIDCAFHDLPSPAVSAAYSLAFSGGLPERRSQPFGFRCGDFCDMVARMDDVVGA
jgi:hypothetical protein